MIARLPKRTHPDPTTARYLVSVALQTAAATTGVRLDPSERWDWQSQTFISTAQKHDPRAFAFQLRPLEPKEAFTPKGYRRRVKGKPVYAPYSSFRLNDRLKSGQSYTNACCWHGHRDFLRAFFKVLPHATVKTTYITYKGLDDFERTYPDTARHYAYHTCNCEVRS